jgi:hypothetical protein
LFLHVYKYRIFSLSLFLSLSLSLSFFLCVGRGRGGKFTSPPWKQLEFKSFPRLLFHSLVGWFLVTTEKKAMYSASQSLEWWQLEKENVDPCTPTDKPRTSSKKDKTTLPRRTPLSDITELVVGSNKKYQDNTQQQPQQPTSFYRPLPPKNKEKRLLSLR